MSAVFTGLWGLLFISSVFAGIYGNDDRYSTHEVTDQSILANAHASAALVERAKLIPYTLSDGSGYLIQLKGLNAFRTDASRVCSTSKFSDTINLAQCSGVLISPRTIMSAGHCFQSIFNEKRPDRPLSDWVWVFDYKTEPGARTIFIPRSSVFEISHSSMADLRGQDDFALFQIVGAVPREPALFSLSSKEVSFGEEHYMIGHPTGMPQVVSRRGFRVKVPRSLEEPQIFYSNLDAFGGNSGSAVFDQVSNRIVGILTRGKNDYEIDLKRKCFLPSLCPEAGCRLKKVDGEYIPPAETVYKTNKAAGLLAKAYEYNFRDEVEYAIQFRLNQYLAHVFDYMESIPYSTYMRSTKANNILSLLIQSNSSELVQRVVRSPRLMKMSMDAGKDVTVMIYRMLPEETFLEVLHHFPDANYTDPYTRLHLVFNAIHDGRPRVIEAFMKHNVPQKLSEVDRSKLKTMLKQKGYLYDF